MLSTLICAVGVLYTPPHWYNRTFSVYSPQLHGSKLASRGRYDRNKFTCASNTHKLGTVLEVSYQGRSCLVTVKDRMAKRFTHSRIDLSSVAFKKLYPKYDMSSVSSMQRTETIIKGKFRVVSVPLEGK